MSDAENKTNILESVQDKIMPIANKVGQQRHIQAISSGLMYTIPLTLLGAVFSIIANPPITEALMEEGGWYASLFGWWYNFALTYRAELLLPTNMTMGLLSIVAVMAISYNLAKAYNLKSISVSLTALVMFLIVSAPAVPAYLQSALAGIEDLSTAATVNVLETSYLGSAGLFVAIVVAIFSTEITKFCIKRNLVIKMPDSVPPNVSESFSSVIPVMINCMIFYGISLFSQNVLSRNFPTLIMSILTPAISNVNTPFAIIAIITLGNFLWLFGIHGAAITSTLWVPVMMQMTAANAEIVASGGSPVFQPVFLTGFSNAFFGITLLLLFAKSKQLKALGKVSIVPGVFLISEPVIFGAPIMFNPILAIPCLLAPIINMLLGYIAFTIGFIQAPFNLIFAQLPIGLNAFFGSMSFNNLFFYMLTLVVQVMVWYPFFKIYDRQLVHQESEQEQLVEE